MDFGIKTGLQIRIDGSRGMWLRTVYSRIGLGPDGPSEAIAPSLLIDWYAGKKWKFYLDGGAQHYVGGPLEDTDLFWGLGVSRRIWTAPLTYGYKIPFHLDGFAEVTFDDGSGQIYGNYMQINVGIKAGKPIPGD
jgi:hypothetical protein